MAVNGFLVDNEVQKYNYESLENYNTPDFSTSSTYQVGDYVMYQGKLYKCITAITTSGAWDSSKWSLAILSDDVANLRSFVESGEYGLSEPVKQAILQIARKVVYVDDQGQTYYDDLYDALYPLNVVSIFATYTQSGTVYDNDTLDSLKADLVVTATYSDTSTVVIPSADYTLSGTLTVGTSTITVSYEDKTTTFTVVVTEYTDTSIHNWDFTQSLTDSVGNVTATLSPTGASRDSSGLHITTSGGYCFLGTLTKNNDISIELDISEMNRKGSNHGRLIMRRSGSATEGTGDGFIYNQNGYWATWFGFWSSSSGITSANAFAGKTIRFYYNKDGDPKVKLFVDGEQVFSTNTGTYSNPSGWQIGSSSNSFYDITITGLRIYEGV